MAPIASSDRLGRAGARALSVAALLCAACAALPARPVAAQQLSVAGTHGLWVHHDGDSVAISWMTPGVAQGTIRVTANGSTRLRRTTPAAWSHRVALPAAGLDTIEIRFGTDGLTREQTTVRIGLTPPVRPAAVLPMPDTLFIVGDTHGQFDQLIRGLRAARLIGADRRWRGGRSHLVFAGDMTDRGPDVLALLWFIHGLQPQARAAGGDVHVVLGNHELMVMLGDLRYVHEKELFVAQQHGVPYSELFDPRHSVLGRWLASLPAMIRLGDVLVAHGGVTPEYARLMIEGANDSLALYLRDPATASLSRPATTAPDSAAVPPAEESAVDPARAAANARYRFLWDDRSIFWHRGYVRGDAPDAELAEALELTSARMLVVGHTGVVRIAPAYGGRVIAAHTPQFGAQLLMLVRTQDGVQRFRVGREGTEQF